MSFSQPAPASDVKIADYVGHLLLFYPRSIRSGVVTTNGIADPLVTDVVILTHPEGPKAEANVLVFQKVLIGSLKGSIGQDPVLGRLARGVAKPGQSAPYVLNEFDQNDAAYATQYLNSVGGNPFPSFQPAAAPAPQPVPTAVPVAQAPVPAAVPVAAPIPVAAPAPVAPAVASAPLPQAPGVPAAPPAWAAPQAPVPAAAPVAQVPQAVPNQAEAMAAMAALGMTQMPPAPPATA
ncbi:hypothetical protein [Nonomuraea sp. NPDC005650]|uniref:hypothetical protein n=1 Tax=Nonomuraea sp. NPDC005650 TaxID=3157045 RepID=UPI0033B314CB